MTDETAVDTHPTKIVYVAEATAHGGRDGFVTSQDGQVDLKVAVSLPVLDAEIAATLVDAAHEVCPYSNATRGNIDPRSCSGSEASRVASLLG